jgi:hypothetical protein
MLATFTGFVDTGVDATGTFDLGDNLDGASFVAHYVYETKLGIKTVTPTYDSRIGGPAYGGTLSPILFADFTLNGHTELFDVGQNGASNVFLNLKDGWLQTFFYTDFFADFGGGNARADFLQLYVLDSPMLIRLTTPYTGFNHVFPGPPAETNMMAYSSYEDGVLTKNFHANLTTTSVTLSPVAVPEPATWGLLILGFFGLGQAVRRRRFAT